MPDDTGGFWGDDVERDIYESLVGHERDIFDDQHLQILFHEAYFDRDLDAETRASMQDELERYMLEEYDMDFDNHFDWVAYREWYG
jgi:hypothetical protein